MTQNADDNNGGNDASDDDALGEKRERPARQFYVGICYGPDDGYTLEEARRSVGAGWASLVERAYGLITAAGGSTSQVKEKYGALRVYPAWPSPPTTDPVADVTEDGDDVDASAKNEGASSESGGYVIRVDIGPFQSFRIGEPNAARRAIYAALDEIERESLVTCERCGAQGSLVTGGWLKTLCPSHAERYMAYGFADQREWDPAVSGPGR